LVKAGIFSLIATSKFDGKDKLKWGKDDGVRGKKFICLLISLIIAFSL
jgi:hypothetical protein